MQINYCETNGIAQLHCYAYQSINHYVLAHTVVLADNNLLYGQQFII